MSFQQSLSESFLLQETNNNITQGQKKNLLKLGFCLVCGDKARIINYGALSCQSCKTFFRRKGFHSETVYPCLFNGSCEVDLKTRRRCVACRFAKCILVGMSSELIRKEEKKYPRYSLSTRSNKIKLIISKQFTPLSPLPILNLRHDDRYFLSSSDWTLLSNIVYAHNTFSIIPRLRCTIEGLSISSTEMYFDLANVVEIIKSMFTSMQSFISSSPDFRVLTVNEQISLVERNLYGVTGLFAVLVFRDSGIIENTKCMESFRKIYGLEMIVQANRFNKQLEFDSTIVKIILIIFAFSSNCLVVNTRENLYNDSLLFGTHRLIGSQNVYVELLWKYMIYRYGFHDSALRFARLITLLLELMKCLAVSYENNITHHDLVDDIIEKTKQSLIINENEHVSLWAKI